jgi:hypothetical protein
MAWTLRASASAPPAGFLTGMRSAGRPRLRSPMRSASRRPTDIYTRALACGPRLPRNRLARVRRSWSVGRELREPGAVQIPADHQHRLPVAAQSASASAGTRLTAAPQQQPREEVYRVLPDLEHSGMRHDGVHAKPRPYEVDPIDKISFYQRLRTLSDMVGTCG